MQRTGRALVTVAACAIAGGCALSRAGLGPAESRDDGGAVPTDASRTDDALGTDGAPSDSPPADDSPEDVAQEPPPTGDAAPTEAGTTGTVSLATVGAASNATGLGMQTHLVYAAHAKLWWLFWVASSQSKTIQTSWSSDFVHWSPGAPLTLQLDTMGQGANFSVAYADVQGADVVHLTIDAYAAAAPTRHHLHARALITGSTIAFGAVDDLSQIQDSVATDPDGPATFVDALGDVWDATGWYAGAGGDGNEAICESKGPETGATTWPNAFGAQSNVYTATGTVHARAFATAGSNLLVAVCDEADTMAPTPTSSGVDWMTWTGAAWSGGNPVFAAGKSQNPHDWGVATLTNGHMHVARRATDCSFDHVRFDGAAWTTLAPPPADPLGCATGQGVVLLASGPSRVALVTIAGDLANSVRMIVWNNTAWGSWTTLEGSTASRGWVSGWWGPANDAIAWTEGDGMGGYRIMGRLVAF